MQTTPEVTQEVVTQAVEEVVVEAVKPDTIPVAELVVWNKSPNNISFGCALIRGDQLHVDFFASSQLKNLTPEQEAKLTKLRPDEATVLKLATAK